MGAHLKTAEPVPGRCLWASAKYIYQEEISQNIHSVYVEVDYVKHMLTG